ncbi:MAG: MBL fold metallo-hydrolase [Pseudomonadales bacterium]|nr:MBL fold metallo-hydrolase [Pseudomonadales bacterium]
MTANLKFPFSTAPEGGEIKQVADGVYWLRMPLPFSLKFINLWLLEDDDSWVIVDTGVCNDETEMLWKQIFEKYLGGKPVSRVIATHCHPDHIGMAGWLTEYWDIELWIPQAEWQQARMGVLADPETSAKLMSAHYDRLGIPADAMKRMRRIGNYFKNMNGNFPITYRRVTGDSKIKINGRIWTVLIGHGHSPEHASYYCKELDVIIGGDMLLPKITPAISVSMEEPNGNPLQQFVDSLEQFYDVPDTVLILPSHEMPYYNLHTRLDELKEHHDQRCQLIVDNCEESKSAMEITEIMFAHRELNDFDILMALGEAVAHIHMMMYQGKLKRFANEQGSWEFIR